MPRQERSQPRIAQIARMSAGRTSIHPCYLCDPWFVVFGQALTAAAADRHVVHQVAAGAACLQAGREALAARLDHGGAFLVATGASDRDAIFGRLALA